ncbi:glycosyltransferase [Metabacillus arenae]|uniref:Glycosyltransferase n=1 Tax=Metabacillus arenae TaxID=2771434 RepID=A0A926S3J3_9BACI|nr:glycosyltransferase [Metabacillus arenae]MBD1383014.1 glycosyltransferase [Metabacillus arenae]
MKFSVLMPVYHGDKAEFVDQAIESLFIQTLIPNEVVIVVDGKIGSDTSKILEKYSSKENVVIHQLDKNVGLGDALKIGLQKCSHEFVARMDADDICHKERFEKQVEFLEANKHIDLVGSFIKEFTDQPADAKVIRKVPVHHEEILNYSKKRNPLNHMTVMYRKQAVLDSGSYQKFLWFEDYYLWVRMIQSGKKLHNIPEPLVFARTGHDMYKRRGGFQYLLNDVKLQCNFLRSGYITIFQYITNILLRSLVRMIPNKFREAIYLKFLRN